jgi:hypothetical protein
MRKQKGPRQLEGFVDARPLLYSSGNNQDMALTIPARVTPRRTVASDPGEGVQFSDSRQ